MCGWKNKTETRRIKKGNALIQKVEESANYNAHYKKHKTIDAFAHFYLEWLRNITALWILYFSLKSKLL